MFWIIRLFFRFLLGIWRFFWRLVWTVVILLLIAFGVVWYLSGDFHSAVNQVEKMSQIGQGGWNQWQETGTLEVLSQTDSHQHAEGKWLRPQLAFILSLKWMRPSKVPMQKP